MLGSTIALDTTTATTITVSAAAPVAATGNLRRPLSRIARTMAVAALTMASNATAVGDPTSGTTKNGMANVARIAPAVFAARSRPAFAAMRSGSSSRSADVAGNVKPITQVAGKTTRMIGLNTAMTDSNGRFGSMAPGTAITATRP